MSKNLSKKFPKLIEDLHNINQFDLDKFLHCGIPFMPLNLKVPLISEKVFNQTVADCYSWRSQWKDVEDDYQTHDWTGSVLFGPNDWNSWLKTIEYDLSTFTLDYDAICKKYRYSQEFTWRVDESNPMREWINSIFENKDLYLVNVINIPPGGYLFPHIDKNPNPHLNKIYIAVNWPEGNHFHFNGFGEIPISDNTSWLINNYRYSHWAYNDSDENRLVIMISANLSVIKNIIFDSWTQMLNVYKNS